MKKMFQHLIRTESSVQTISVFEVHLVGHFVARDPFNNCQIRLHQIRIG